MDKFEYELKVEQIEKLIGREDYSTAKKIADTMEWKKEKDPVLLSKVAELYTQSGDINKAMTIFNRAYNASARGLLILERMTELAINYGQLELANELCQEYRAQGAYEPDVNMFEFMISEARGEDYEKRIPYLEKYCKSMPDEDALYKLACLYDKVGRQKECIKICDYLIDFFRFGDNVKGAVKLKTAYEPLDRYQEKIVADAPLYEENFKSFTQAEEEEHKREEAEKHHAEKILQDAYMQEQEDSLGKQISEIVEDNEREKHEIKLDSLVAEEELNAQIELERSESGEAAGQIELEGAEEPEGSDEPEMSEQTEGNEAAGELKETREAEEPEEAEKPEKIEEQEVAEEAEETEEVEEADETEEAEEADETEEAEEAKETEEVEEAKETEEAEEPEEAKEPAGEAEESEESKRINEPSEAIIEEVAGEDYDEEAEPVSEVQEKEKTIVIPDNIHIEVAGEGYEEEIAGDDPDESIEEAEPSEAEGVDAVQPQPQEADEDKTEQEEAETALDGEAYEGEKKPERRKEHKDLSALELMIPEGSFTVACSDTALGEKYALELVRLVPEEEAYEHIAKITSKKLNKAKFSFVEEQLDNDILMVTGAGQLSNGALDSLYAWMKKSLDNRVIFIDDKAAIAGLAERRPKLMKRFSGAYEYEKKNKDEWMELVESYADENDCELADDAKRLFEEYLDSKEEEGDVVLGINLKEAIQDAMHEASRVSFGNMLSAVLSTKYDEEGLLILRDRHFL